MARALAAGVYGAVACIGAAMACSTFSSDEMPATPETATDASTDVALDGAAADALTDAPTDAGTDAWPPGAIYYESFEDTSGCRLENVTCTLEHTTALAYAGSASCRVCATTNQGGGLHVVPIPLRAGTVRLEAHARLDSPDASATSAWWAHLAVYKDGGYLDDNGKYGPVTPGGWAFAQNSWTPAGSFDEVELTIGVNKDNGEQSCVFIDDVALYIDK